jgi:flagellar capping protein FliD
LERQIGDIERRLEQRRAVMEAAFIRMEEAQSRINSQQQTLTNAFFPSEN